MALRISGLGEDPPYDPDWDPVTNTPRVPTAFWDAPAPAPAPTTPKRKKKKRTTAPSSAGTEPLAETVDRATSSFPWGWLIAAAAAGGGWWYYKRYRKKGGKQLPLALAG